MLLGYLLKSIYTNNIKKELFCHLKNDRDHLLPWFLFILLWKYSTSCVTIFVIIITTTMITIINTFICVIHELSTKYITYINYSKSNLLAPYI